MAFPTTSVIDNFTRADQNPIAGAWTGPTFSGGEQIKLVTNAVTAQSGAAGYSHTTATYGPDCEAYTTLVAGVSGSTALPVGVTLRLQSPGTTGLDGYEIIFASGSWGINRIDNGAETQIGASFTMTPSVGDKFGLEAIGNVLTAYRFTGGSWASFMSRTDSAYSSAGNVGLAAADTVGWAMDDFGGGTVVSAAGAFDKPKFYRPAIWSLKSVLRQPIFNRQFPKLPPLPIFPWDRADPVSEPRVIHPLRPPTISLADVSRVINLSAVLGDVTSVTAISAPGTINLSKTLGDVTATGTISVPSAIALTAVLGNVTAVTAISVPGTINLSAVLANVTATGAISVPSALTLSAVLGNVTAVTAISVPGTINLSAVLADTTLSATLGVLTGSVLDLSAALGNVTAVTAISVPGTINLSAVLGNVTATGAISVPSALTLSAVLGNVTAVTAISAPGTINLSVVLGNTTLGATLATSSALNLSTALGNVTATATISVPEAINLSAVLGNTTLAANLVVGVVGAHAINLQATLGNTTLQSGIVVGSAPPLAQVIDIGANWRMDYLRHKRLEDQDERDIQDIARIFAEWRRAA